jgi:NAD-dependent deacetylase
MARSPDACINVGHADSSSADIEIATGLGYFTLQGDLTRLKMQRIYKRIVVLTGAGISAESGIRTFRASDGLWEDHRVEDVATPRGFLLDPELVHRFYNARRRQLFDPGIAPNAAHLALAKLESESESSFLLVTQNVDNLHERAGSQRLIHMHGELLRVRCAKTGEIWPWESDCDESTICPACHRPGHLRPHIVWFGEVPLAMNSIFMALDKCDLFMSIGTSGNVYPAADFVRVARKAGAHTVELNLEPSAVHSNFDETIYGTASNVVPEFIDHVLCNH